MKREKVTLIVGLILIACGILAVTASGSTLVLTCARNVSLEIHCDQLWTWLGTLPKSQSQPFDFAELKYTCYNGGCNFYINHVASNGYVTLAGTGTEPVLAFITNKSDYLRYELTDGSSLTGIYCIAIPAFSLAGVALIYAWWTSTRRKQKQVQTA